MEELQKSSQETLFDRARLGTQVYDDPDFREDFGIEDDFKLMAELDRFFYETSRTFAFWRALYLFCGEKERWTGPLQPLIAEYEAASAREDEGPKRERKVISKAMHLEVIKKLEISDAENTRLQQQVEELTQKLIEAEKKISFLEGRLAQLEKLSA